MKKIGKERTAGFSLLEVAVAIAIIGLISAPICTSLILAGRINAHSQAVMEAHLNVRTAVETLMKDGVTAASDNYRADAFPNVTVITVKDGENPYYHVTVTDKHAQPLVTVETFVRAVLPEGGGT
jgi:prepilin-type N-terminal cleavage/methylation domain-containing protein